MPVTGKIQIEGGLFQNFEGAPLALGYLIVQLSHDEQESVDPGLVTGLPKLKIALDSSGNIPVSPATMIWPNDQLLPSGSQYEVWGYAADGTFVFGPQFWNLTSAVSPYNVANQLPSNPPGNGVGGSGGGSVILQTNGTQNTNQALLNLANGTNVTITNSAGTTTINATGASFATSGQGFFFGFQDIQPISDVGQPGAMVETSTAIGVAQLNLPYSIRISNASLYVITDPGVASVTYSAIYSADGNTKLVDVVGGFNLNTGSQVLKNVAITPVTLAPGSYLFAIGNVNGSSAFGTVAGHQAYNAYFINSLLNANHTRVARAANVISGGAMPATLGALTAFTHSDNSLGLPAVMFQA